MPRAREQTGQRAADDRDQRDQRVAERVMIDDLALRKALGAGGADIVRVEHLQHVGAHITHQRADGDDGQRDNGQHQMVRFIHELAEGRQLVVIAADKAHKVEPPQLDRKEQLQQRGKEERRQRDADQRERGNRVVGAGILPGGRNHAERHRNEDLEEERDGAHDERQPDRVVELFHHRYRVLPRISEMAGAEIAQPAEIAGKDVLVKAVHRVELRQPLLIGFCARSDGKLHRARFHERGRQAPHDEVDDEGDAEQDQH